jgi:hypothetical protein
MSLYSILTTMASWTQLTFVSHTTSHAGPKSTSEASLHPIRFLSMPSCFEALLEPFPALRIVLATSWVREFGYDFALRQLTPNLQSRVVGGTWRDGMQVQPPARYYCIQMDAEERGLERWLALDDDL